MKYQQSANGDSLESQSSEIHKIHFLRGSPFLLAVVANLLWGTSFLASKYTLQVWGPFTASALRFAIALVAMLFFLPGVGFPIQIPRTRRAWIQILWVALSGFGVLYPMQLAGLNWIPSSLSASIMLSSPLFVLLLTAGLFQESLSAQKLTAIFVGIVGGMLLVSPANIPQNLWSAAAIPHLLKGITFTVAASASLAISVLATRSAVKAVDSTSVTFWSMGLGVIFLLPFTLFESQKAHTPEQFNHALIALLFLSLFCSVFAFLMWNRAITLTNPQNIASTMHIKTPVAVLLGLFVANEKLSLGIVLGAVLISLAVWFSQWKPEKTAVTSITPQRSRI